MNEVYEQIKRDESFRAHAYRCSSGALTIGYGRNIDEEAGGPGISKVEAGFMLRIDLAKAEDHLQQIFPNWSAMGQVRRNAFINMRYNLGPSRFLGFINMISAAKRGYWEVAGREAEDSLWFYQVGVRALRIVQEIKTGVSL